MRRRLPTILILGCFLALVAASYGRALFRGEQFAYRDAAHFYYPLYQRVQAEWEAGRWPLWEPEENGGMPLLGNPTAAVLYPGKVLYALFRYDWGARLYVVAHTVLAFAGMLILLRSWGTSVTGSALGALSYAFGGPILFQYCNIIFLVGAAWLPFGIRAVDRWLRLGRRSALIELAVVLAMQALGGDPETAYLTGLCAGGYAVGLAWRRGHPTAPPVPGWRVALTLGAAVTVWVVATIELALRLPPLRPRLRPGYPALAFSWMGWAPLAIAALWGCAGLCLLARWRRRGRSPLGVMLVGLAGSAVLAGRWRPCNCCRSWSSPARAPGRPRTARTTSTPSASSRSGWPSSSGPTSSGPTSPATARGCRRSRRRRVTPTSGSRRSTSAA